MTATAMNRLTPLEISITHGTCAQAGCAICNRKSLKEVAGQLAEAGFQVESYREDSHLGFGYIEVKEQGSDCARLLRQPCGSA